MKARELRETIVMLRTLKILSLKGDKDTTVCMVNLDSFNFAIDEAIEALKTKQDTLRSKDCRGGKMNLDSTREEFENLDYYKPTDELHDSGFKCMKFALINGTEVVGCAGGGSDIIRLNGIGGYGKYNEDFDEALKTNKTRRIAWAI